MKRKKKRTTCSIKKYNFVFIFVHNLCMVFWLVGVRFMHCHYDRHLSWGMDFAFIVKNGDTSGRSMRHPLAYMPPCTASAADHSLRLFDFSDEKLNTFFRT